MSFIHLHWKHKHILSQIHSVLPIKKKLSPVVLNIKNLENELNSTKIKRLNFYQVMLESKNPLNFYPFKLKGHFTPQGYKTLAKEIQNLL